MSEAAGTRKFRYDTTGAWHKGNAHIHSQASDGGQTFAQLARMYAGAGYDFLFRTDHRVGSDVAADAEPYPLLWLDGIELDGADYTGAYYHVICLGTVRGVTRETPFVAALESARAQGALLVLAHPLWTGNSADDALRWGFHGVETYNHVCQWLNGKGDSLAYWNAMLARSPATLGLSVDDAHIRAEHPGWNGGWIMVNAPDRSRGSLLAAIRRGNFYSTCGPEILSIEAEGHIVTVRTGPIRFARLVGPGWRGARVGSFDGPLITEAIFTVPADWPYAYVDLEDDQGRRAWTNTLFV